eukprot:TRINITY_DN10124_c0_g1_i1.p1 TRINITY_DN10124_c0_g1~~TRINITY_DN10124_c0_g1_i1.p1  ORF type:complete len:268 (+),score=62.05 TRINITY_DN10124_c0_g1_i1:76-804(+)
MVSAEEPPGRFVCPITTEVMVSPVMTRSGINYERAAIEQWLRVNPHCPSTREALSASDLYPNRALQEEIAEWRRGRGLPEPAAPAPGAVEEAARAAAAAAAASGAEHFAAADKPAATAPLRLGGPAAVVGPAERLRELCRVRCEPSGGLVSAVDVWNPAMAAVAGAEGVVEKVDLADATVFVRTPSGGWWLPVLALSAPGRGAFRWPPTREDLRGEQAGGAAAAGQRAGAGAAAAAEQPRGD